MQRHRSIAAAPIRSATAAWQTLITLISDTLKASEAVSSADVATAIASLSGLGPALVAGGHLELSPIVLVSGVLDVSFTVVTGDAATKLEENLNAVPGGATATADWMLHLPTPAPLAKAISDAAAASPHLSTEPPPTTGANSAATTNSSVLNLEALRESGRR